MGSETAGDCSPSGRPGDEPAEDSTYMGDPDLGSAGRTLGLEPNLSVKPDSIESSCVSKGVQDVTMTDQPLRSTTITATTTTPTTPTTTATPTTCEAGTRVSSDRAADGCAAPLDSSTVSRIKATEAECELVVVSKRDVSIGKKGSGSSNSTSRKSGKVIVTDVTINSLTVTFKEALTAEGFFKGCGMK